MKSVKFWVACLSKDHSIKATIGGFIQVCHGKQAPLKRMTKGDFLLVYSAKETMQGTEKVQAFTALGKVIDTEIYTFEMSNDFKPHRRNIEFYQCKSCDIIPLLEDLTFIKDKKHWGYPFRYGFFEISQKDFTFIASKMRIE